MMPEGLDRIRNARILVVEDSIANQTLARDLLLHAGAHVDLAGNGKEAIKAIEDAVEPYDAVLMDLQMPIMDGLEATRIIRGELSQDSLPIIATTANTEKREQKLCRDVGANDYLPKPFHIHELYAILIRWLRPVERTSEAVDESRVEQPVADDVALPVSIDGVDIMAGLARTGQDRALLAELLVEFANTNKELGHEADAAAAAGDLERVRFLAHGIRSTAGTIGAEALSSVATAVEREIVDGGDGLPALLMKFRAALEGVVSAILSADIVTRSSAVPLSTRGGDFDREKAERLVGILQDMLDNQDLGAQQEFDKLAGMLSGRGHDDTLRELGRNLDALEFSNARQILARVGKGILD
jgi:CheY-like chemotaxis protein